MGRTSALRQQRGSVIVTLALVMTGLLSMVALAINGAFVTDVHSELQNTADAMATAATSGLLLNQAEAKQLAKEYAQRNAVLGQPMSLEGQSVEIGLWSFERNDFFPTTAAPNSVRVTLQLNDTSSPSAPSIFLGPFLGQQTTTMAVTATASLGSRSIVFAMDRSGSMDNDTVSGGDPEPLTGTKEAAKQFLDMIQLFPIEGDRMGLVSYNHDATLDHQLTENFSAVKTAIDGLKAGAWTNIAAALCRAHEEVISARAAERGASVIVLLSDGKTNTTANLSTCQRNSKPGRYSSGQLNTTNPAAANAKEEAENIAADGVILYTISLGNLTNQALMEEMAALSGGEHFFAPTTDDLDDVFRQISEQIPVVLVE